VINVAATTKKRRREMKTKTDDPFDLSKLALTVEQIAELAPFQKNQRQNRSGNRVPNLSSCNSPTSKH
jgi:hypothetical protein